MSACDQSFISQVLSGNAIVCDSTFQDALTSAEQSDIGQVVQNAVDNYGSDSAAAVATASEGAQQAANAVSDNQAITNSIANTPTCGLDFSFIGGPCIPYKTLEEIGIGLAAALLLGFFIYGYAILSPFIPKGRR